MMKEALLFAKKQQTKEGRTFYKYLTTLKKKESGEEIMVEVNFPNETGKPNGEKCPLYINYDKTDANLVTKQEHYKDKETGEDREATRRTLWIKKYTVSDKVYVDTSLDEFE